MPQRLANIKILGSILPPTNGTDSDLYFDYMTVPTSAERKSVYNPNQQSLYNISLHVYNHTKGLFPALNLNPDFVPAITPMTKCLTFDWAPIKLWRV